MYIPKHFNETRPEELHRVIEDFPFAALVVHGPAGLDANHLPFEFDPKVGTHGVLRAHVARANPVWKEIEDGAQALVIFRAADAYISPNWFPSKHELHRQVPTWNYQVVHVHGKLRLRDEERFVRGLVARLTRRHEARVKEPKPWKMSDSTPDYIDGMLAAIVGVEIEIERIVGKFKVSQNREARDLASAADRLHALGEVPMGDAMRKALDEKR